MARNTGGNRGDVRQSALWGSGNRGGEFRSNALWGKGGRGSVVTLVGVLVLSLAAGAASARGTAPQAARAVNATVVEAGLLERAQANPKQKFRIIVQSAEERRRGGGCVRERGEGRTISSSRTRRSWLKNEQAADKAYSAKKTKAERAKGRPSVSAGGPGGARRLFARLLGASSMPASASSTVSRWRCPAGGSSGSLGSNGLTITEDVEVRISSRHSDGPEQPAEVQLQAALGARVRGQLTSGRRRCGAHACDRIVDSGIDASRADFAGAGGRRSTSSARATPTGRGDGRGHGRFVAGIAAGARRTSGRCTECAARLARRHGRLRIRPDE